MIAAQKWMDVITQNLANTSTIGYKRDGVAFANMVERQMQLGAFNLGTLGNGPQQVGEFTEFEPGALIATKNPLDVAIGGEKGVFGVQTPNGIAYTRDGSFGLNSERVLVNKQGYPVLSDASQPIRLDAGEVRIQQDGSIEVDGKPSGKIGVFDGTFQKIGGSLFSATGRTTTIETELKPQSLESSNVNAIESMVQMITLNRTFELAQKSISQQDDLTQRLIQSLQEH